VIYYEVLREYLKHAVFEERDWLEDMDNATGPVQAVFRTWQGGVITIEKFRGMIE
jgi:hypothetical protein